MSEKRKRTESDMDLDQSGAENDSPNDAAARQRAIGGGGGSGSKQRYSEYTSTRYDRMKVICRLLIPSKAAGAVIGKSGSTIKGLRDQYGCSVMIPALDVRGPERIITIKAANYQLIGKIVARCCEHLDEFLRRQIPLRLLLPTCGLRNQPPHPVKYAKANFSTNIHIFGINCPGSNERVITIGGTPEGKGETVACFLERSDQVIAHHKEELLDYDPNQFDDNLDYGGFNQFGQRRDNQQAKDHKVHNRPQPEHHHHHHHQHHNQHHHSHNADSEKVFTQNNQQFGKDQLWLKKLILPESHFLRIVGKGGAILEEVRKFSGARMKYGQAQNEHRLLSISGNHEQIDTAIHILQCIIAKT